MAQLGEKKTGRIPSVIILKGENLRHNLQWNPGQRLFSLLLTDRRSIFVLQFERRPTVVIGTAILGVIAGGVLGILLGGVFVLRIAEGVTGATIIGGFAGGALGITLGRSLTTKRYVRYESIPPETLAADVKNIAIPHEYIKSIQFRRGIRNTASLFIMEYEKPDDKRGRLIVYLEPPPWYIKRRKSEGLGKGQARLEYMKRVQEAYRNSLPQLVASQVQWLKSD